MTLTVTGDDALGFLHIYAPAAEDYFCIEPVSAMPEAMNRPEPSDVTGLRVLQPGETCSVSMEISVRYGA